MNPLARWWSRRRAAPEGVPGDPERVAEVRALLAEQRATFAADGGDVELVRVQDGVVEVELKGACASCAASAMTLELLLRPKLRERFAWFVDLRRV